MPASSENALEIVDLEKRYTTGVEALRGVSISIEPGDFYGLLGPNGAGKSTLMHRPRPTTSRRPISSAARSPSSPTARSPRRGRARTASRYGVANLEDAYLALVGRRSTTCTGSNTSSS